MVQPWKQIDSKLIYRNKWLKLREDRVLTPDNSEGIYSVVELASDFIYIVAINEDNKLILTKQFRYPINATTWELPAGQTDGQALPQAAERELLEETGYKAVKFSKIGEIYGDTGVYANLGHVFLATGIQKSEQKLDISDGIIEAKAFSVNEIHEMIIYGQIKCPHTIASFYLAINKMEAINGRRAENN